MYKNTATKVTILTKGENTMLKENHNNQNHNHSNNVSGVAAGLFIGGLIGAVTMLFLAPQSGKRTRAQVQQKSLEFRDRAVELVEDTVSQAQKEGKKLTRTAQHKAKEIMHQGQELVAEQLAHVSEAVETKKKEILGS
jgi:gas vesicle protein